MPRPKPAAVPPQPPVPVASRYVLALGAVFITAGTIASSLRPSAANWGLHASGFLDPARRNVLLAILIAATAVVVYALLGPRGGAATPPARRSKRLAVAPWLLLAAWLGAAFYLPVKEPLLGDSTMLIENVQAEGLHLASEPLSVRALDLYADVARARGGTTDLASLGIVSRVAGVAAGILLVLIAGEIGGGAWTVVTALLLTLGMAQFFLGYVETYPIALVFVLLYIWLGLRAARGRAPVLAAGAALGVAATAHVTALFLLPSYIYLVLRTGTRARQALALLTPFAIAATVFALLRYDLANLAHPFRVATQAAASATTDVVFRRPYPFVSLAHAQDVANVALLAAPVALLLLIAGAIALPRKPASWPPAVAFLAGAAVPGLLAVVALMTPVAPAQDWDLFAFLLAPAALLGVAAAAAAMPGVLRGAAAWGLTAFSLALLAPFVLVNADSRASIARFEAVIADPARVSPYGRAYGSEVLWVLHRDRGDRDRALVHAEAAYAAEPSNPRYSVNLGHTLLELRRVNEAIPYFQNASAAAPTRWDAPFNLGLSYSSLRRYPEAVTALREAARRDPNRPEVYAALVGALMHAGQEDSAVAVWNKLKAGWPVYVAEQEKKYAARSGGR